MLFLLYFLHLHWENILAFIHNWILIDHYNETPALILYPSVALKAQLDILINTQEKYLMSIP